MSIDQCSQKLGVSPGWYDGIYGVFGLPMDNKCITPLTGSMPTGRSLLIQTMVKPLSNIRVFCQTEFTCMYHLGDLLYDRTLMRLFGSNSRIATFTIFILGIVVSILPA